VDIFKNGYFQKVDIFKKWLFSKSGYFQKVDILNLKQHEKVDILILF